MFGYDPQTFLYTTLAKNWEKSHDNFEELKKISTENNPLTSKNNENICFNPLLKWFLIQNLGSIE